VVVAACAAGPAQRAIDAARIAETQTVLRARVGPAPSAAPVFVGVGDSGECFTRMLENWLCHFRRLGVREYVFFALDANSYSRMVAAGEPTVNLTAPTGARAGGAYGSEAYYSATRSKVFAAAAVVACGYDIVLLDIDVALMRDPRPYLARRAADLNADMQFQLNYPSRDFNTGVYHARATAATKALLERWLAACEAGRTDDQGIFFAMLRRDCPGPENVFFKPKAKVLPASFLRIRRCEGLDVRVESLPVMLFRTGHRGLRLKGDPRGDTFCWHANFMVGGRRKHEWLLASVPASNGTPAWCAPNRTVCSEPRVWASGRGGAGNLPPGPGAWGGVRGVRLVSALAVAAGLLVAGCCLCLLNRCVADNVEYEGLGRPESGRGRRIVL